MPTITHSKSPIRRKTAKKTTAPVKKAFKFELTAEDFALDNAISAAAARSLALRQA